MVSVDVIIPVYNQLELLEQCIDSLQAADCATPHRIVVVDDCSSDPQVRAYLADMAESGAIELHTNRENLGFTRTVNFGMQLHPMRDVLLLNSDTIVYPQWLDRIVAAADSANDVATVNPMTGQLGSHISCYPGLANKFDGELEVDDRRLDAITREVNASRYLAVHVTVGFCMFIRRRALDDLGYFDAVHFPVAYGEETDFCYRARKAGWRHLVAGDVFVTHLEGRSFSDRKARLMEEMLERIVLLHPEIGEFDRRFLATDPLRPLRTAMDLGRVKRALDGSAKILVATDQDRPVRGLSPWLLLDAARCELSIQTPGIALESLPNIGNFALPEQFTSFNAMLRALGIKEFTCGSPKTRDLLNATTAKNHPDELGLATPIGEMARA